MYQVTHITLSPAWPPLSPMFQYLIVFAGCALAAPAGPPPPAPVYQAKAAPYKEPVYKPQPYEYKYGVADDYSKSTYDKAETQDEYGNVQGSYKVRKCTLLEMSECVFYCLIPDQSSRRPGPDCELCVRQGWVQSRREL